MAVTGRMGVENPYVKKGVLPPLSPESLCLDVQSGFILRFSVRIANVSPERGMQSRLNPHLGAHFCQELRMSPFVVSQEAESSRITGQGMFHCFHIHTSQAVDIRLPTKP